MKSKYALVGIALVLAATAVIFWLRHPTPPQVPPNFNSPEPCIVRNFFGSFLPPNLCHDKGTGNCDVNLSMPQIMNGNKGELACCPVGFDPKTHDDGATVFCEKKKN
ncbi:MAG TPA: hypothetical protein VGO68_05350 [Pyrinomonadaceae bacterium]|jgi:hypothetical protein|nr:hypothetical protein [Pyrinomonadaceae bacterium]